MPEFFGSHSTFLPMRPLLIAQAVVSVLLIVTILLQQRGSDTGTGLSVGGDFSGGYYTKRGLEKFLYKASIVLGAVFLLLSILNTRLG